MVDAAQSWEACHTVFDRSVYIDVYGIPLAGQPNVVKELKPKYCSEKTRISLDSMYVFSHVICSKFLYHATWAKLMSVSV